MLDFVSVVSIKQAPRFSTYKISADTAIYYDTPFYDVIRCNKDTNDEYYKTLDIFLEQKEQVLREIEAR